MINLKLNKLGELSALSFVSSLFFKYKANRIFTL